MNNFYLNFFFCFFCEFCVFGFSQEELPQVVYDDNHRVSKISYADGKSVFYFYDEKGRRTSMKDWTGETRYEYDFRDLLSKMKFPHGEEVSFFYDDQKRLKTILYPYGKEVFYFYNEENLLEKIRDAMGDTSFVYVPGTTLLSKMTDPRGIETEYHYTPNKLIREMVCKKKDGTIFLQYQYRYHEKDLLSQKVLSAAFPMRGQKYFYDSSLRLLKKKDFEGAEERYTYDSKGQILSKKTSQGKEVFHYDQKGNLLSIGSTVQFVYDEQGRLIEKMFPTGRAFYRYDCRGLLTEYQDEKNHSFFEYNGDGLRVSKTVNGNQVFFLQDLLLPVPGVLMQIVENKDIFSKVSQWFSGDTFSSISFFTYAGNKCIHRMEDPSTIESYLYEGLDNTFLGVLDRFQNVKFSEDDFCFSAKPSEIDPESGLVFFGKSYYDAKVHLWLSKEERDLSLRKEELFSKGSEEPLEENISKEDSV